MSSRRKPRVSAATHRICPHCDKELNLKTYRAHRKLYFDSQSKSWLIASTGKPGKSVQQPKATRVLQPEEIFDPLGDAMDDETNTETDSMDVDVLLECDQQSEPDSGRDGAACLPNIVQHSHMTYPSGNELDIEPQPGRAIKLHINCILIYTGILIIIRFCVIFVFHGLEYWLESHKEVTADIEPPQTLDAVIAATVSKTNLVIILLGG